MKNNILNRFKKKRDIKDVYIYVLAIIVVFILIIIIPLCLFKAPSNGSEEKKMNDVDTVSVNNIKEKDCSHIKVYMTDEKKVVNMDMEEYITGVVAAEMPAAFDEEALKAQAVAARTFAVNHILYKACSKYDGADICDSIHCQAYINKEKRLEGWPKANAEGYWSKISDAVNRTKGEVISYNGELIQYPQYFAVSSGRTEDAVEVFAIDDAPYLKSKESKGEEVAPKYSSEIKVKTKDFVNKLNNYDSKAKIREDSIRSDVEIKSRTQGGSVKEIKIGNVNITGTKFREIFNLNSANFNLKVSNGQVLISCLGYGHGVGMSQWGANIKAKSGMDYKEILSYYYDGTKIEKIN